MTVYNPFHPLNWHDRIWWTPECPHCNGNGHAGGNQDDPNECGFCDNDSRRKLPNTKEN